MPNPQVTMVAKPDTTARATATADSGAFYPAAFYPAAFYAFFGSARAVTVPAETRTMVAPAESRAMTA